MSRTFSTLLALGLFATALPARAQQAQPSAAEAKLREGLRNTMLQLRTMQGERDQLIVEKATLEGEKATLTEKLDELTKQAAANQDAATKTISAQKDQLTMRDQEVAALKAELEKWKVDHKRISEVAATKESQRAKFAEQAMLLQRRVDDQTTKNAAMYKIGSEVLNRYEKFVLGDALAAREPFTGIARVKFQTLSQDFQDQLDDARVKPLEVKNGAATSADRSTADKPASAPPVATPPPMAARVKNPKALAKKPKP